jgi:hypothetical protein
MKRLVRYLEGKHLDKWLAGWARHAWGRRRGARAVGTRHLLFAFCDHWEPLWNGVSDEVGDARVRFWMDRYPELAARFRDADGRSPRHSFFFPGEQYRARWLDDLASLARRGLGEVELHLHHDGDTAPKLRADIARYTRELASHGHLARDPDGRLRYGFIHGNWCLSNSHADGRWCGVDEELPLLFETGCYADFTFPSAPDESQPARVNQIYWPTGDLARRRAYEGGERARVGVRRDDRVLLVEGPLAPALRRHKVPVYVECSNVTATHPGSVARVRTWVAQDIHVEGRPEWVFVKVYTHGAPEAQAASLLGEPGRRLHDALARWNDGRAWRLHYVTAREMYNVAMAAMDGKSGDPSAFFDHALPPPPAAARAAS